MLSVCKGFYMRYLSWLSPRRQGGLSPVQTRRIELAKVTQQIVKLGDFFLLKARDLLTAYDFLLILWPRDGIMYGLRA